MPAHDWTLVDSGLFHSFHQQWISELCAALNTGGLPSTHFALAEQSIRGPVPDVLTLRLGDDAAGPDEETRGVAVAVAPPRARVVQVSEKGVYARRADRVTVRHRHGRVVAVIEIVSPGNKASTSEIRAFVEKVADLIQQGIHVLVVDLFPPTRRDPRGLHELIWDEIGEEGCPQPDDKPLAVVAYSAGAIKTAYVEPFASGDDVPEMPLFLEPEIYVPTPLEATYLATWAVFPAALKRLLDPPESR